MAFKRGENVFLSLAVFNFCLFTNYEFWVLLIWRTDAQFRGFLGVKREKEEEQLKAWGGARWWGGGADGGGGGAAGK